MEYVFKVLFTKASAAGLSAVLFFSSPAIVREGNKFLIMGKLHGVMMPKVEKVLERGKTVKIEFLVSIVAREKDRKRLLSRKFTHSMLYDSNRRIYLLDLNGKRVLIKDRKEAGKILGEYSITLSYKEWKASKYDFYIEAEIDYEPSLQFDAPASKLWDHYIPYKKIKGISSEVIH